MSNTKHPYVAHDQALFSLRNYIQMGFVCLFIGVLIHVSGVYLFMKTYFSECRVPTVQIIQKKPRVTISDNSPKIPLICVWKYTMSFNPGNYIQKKQLEYIEPELEPFFGNRVRIPRSAYVAGVAYITDGRAERFGTVYFPASFIFYLMYIPAYFTWFIVSTRRRKAVEFVRGTDMMPLEKLSEILSDGVKKSVAESSNFLPLHFGPLEFPDDAERSHTLVLGATGTGKSVFMNRLLYDFNARRQKSPAPQKSVIYDVKGEFISKHLKPGNDLIFYPFDQRSIGWSFFNEIEDYEDLDILATSLYQPPKESKDEYWYHAARDVFRMGLFHLMRSNKTKNKDITDFFFQPLEAIKESLLDLPIREAGGLKHIDRSDSNQAASVVSILQERLMFFRYLIDLDGPFSFRHWIRDDSDRRNLYLMNIRKDAEIFKPLMTYVMDVLIREVLSMPDSRDRRILYLIDEFGSLGILSSLFDFLTMARSKGGTLVVANQDLGSVGDLYGEHRSQTYYNNFNNTICFRLNDPKTSDFISKAFGEREVVKKMESRQMSPNEFGDRLSIQSQDKTEKVILGTEFQILPNFKAYCRISNYGTSKITVPHGEKDFLPVIAPYYVKRDFNLTELLADNNTVRRMTSPPAASGPDAPRFIEFSSGAGNSAPAESDNSGVPPFKTITGE